MEDKYQWCLGVSLLEIKGHMEKVLKGNNRTTRAHQQRTIRTFFSPIVPTHTTSQSRAIQMHTWPGHCKGVTIDWATAIYRAHMPRPSGPQSPLHTCLGFIQMHTWSLPSVNKGHYTLPLQVVHHFWDLSILDGLMLEIFERSDLRILHV